MGKLFKFLDPVLECPHAILSLPTTLCPPFRHVPPHVHRTVSNSGAVTVGRSFPTPWTPTSSTLVVKPASFLNHGKTILKYQVRSEDLDTLVSVKSEEDVRHMFNEIDHHERVGSHKLRAFLFPANQIVIEESAMDRSPEQRYIDAVNGIIRTFSSSFSVRPHSPSSGSCVTEPNHNRFHLQKLHSCSHLPTHCHNYGLSNYQFPRPISDSYISPNCQQLTHRQSRGSCPFLNGRGNNVSDLLMRSAPTSPRFPRTESRLAMRSAPSSPPHGPCGPYGLTQQEAH